MGSHCQEQTCKQLDYLPMKCDACSKLYCKDHLLYDDHACSGKYKKNIQVPVCPLCSAPVPVARGAVPDLAVSAHIDQGCPEKKAAKVFTNQCHRVQHGKRCKKHELVACVCSACGINFCLAHRHPADHDCAGPRAAGGAASRAAAAAAARTTTSSSQSKVTDFFTGPFRPAARPEPSAAAQAAIARQAGRGSTPGRPLAAAPRPLAARQVNGMSEDEALAAALAASLATGGGQGAPAAGQEEEDLALARALQESEVMARRGQGVGQGVGQGDKSCNLQ